MPKTIDFAGALQIESAPENPEDEKEIFDFASPEDVLIEVIHDEEGPGYSLETCTVIRGVEGVTGAASYDACYGGFLDYTIMGLIDRPAEGWHVVVGVTGVYTKGDGWMTDDDMTFDFQTVRPATDDEIALA